MESTTYDSSYELSTAATAADTTAVTSFIMGYSVVILVIFLVAVVAMWKMFAKAGQPDWAAIVPFYNIYIMLKIVGRPAWWLLLFFIPFVNIVISVVLALDTAKAFGKDALFGILGNFLFSPVGYLIIGFGSAKYVGPVASEGGPAAPTPPAQPQAPVPPQTPPASGL